MTNPEPVRFPTAEARSDATKAFFRILTDDEFGQINAGYPNIINAPEVWFRRELNVELARRKG